MYMKIASISSTFGKESVNIITVQNSLIMKFCMSKLPINTLKKGFTTILDKPLKQVPSIIATPT